MKDGSIVLVEIARGTLSRVSREGKIDVIAELGGGPNGAAIGPDGKCYVCNNGGFEWIERDGRLYPGHQPADYSGGRIERVDLDTGAVETLYTSCDGTGLRGPNDLVFDRQGGFWFTDNGKTRARERDRTGVFYAKADGSAIKQALFPLEAPNGIGLSAAEDELYVAETTTGRLWAYALSAPGEIKRVPRDRPDGGRFLPGIPGYYLYDSLAVDSGGNVCVATLIQGGISVISTTGAAPRFVPLPDILTTNICFGGPDLRTAYVTLSTIGELIAFEWDRPGLPLNYLDT
jgi:gluconolactonase